MRNASHILAWCAYNTELQTASSQLTHYAQKCGMLQTHLNISLMPHMHQGSVFCGINSSDSKCRKEHCHFLQPVSMIKVLCRYQWFVVNAPCRQAMATCLGCGHKPCSKIKMAQTSQQYPDVAPLSGVADRVAR